MAFFSNILRKQSNEQEDYTSSAGYEDIDASSHSRTNLPPRYMAYFHGTSLGYENVDLEAAMPNFGESGAQRFVAPGYSIHTVDGLLLLFGFVSMILILSVSLTCGSDGDYSERTMVTDGFEGEIVKI